jgi:hypothetical protein
LSLTALEIQRVELSVAELHVPLLGVLWSTSLVLGGATLTGDVRDARGCRPRLIAHAGSG